MTRPTLSPLPLLVALGAAAFLSACGGTNPPVEEPPATAKAAPEEDATLECEGPPVTLTFDWPPTLQAAVRSLEIIEIRDTREPEPSRQAIETRHRLEVAPAGDDLRVAFQPVGDGRPRLDGLILEYGDRRADLRISGKDGTVVGIEGVEAMRAVHDEVRREAGLDEREAQDLLGRLEPEALTGEVRAWWHLVLSGWAGRTLACGEAASSTGRAPVWALGGEEVPMAFEWRYLGHEPCSEESGRGGQECVELAVVGRADPEEARRLHEARIRAVGGERAKGLRVQQAELVRVVQVRLEPRGMVLHGFRAEEHVGSAIELPDGKEVARRQSEGHAVAFQYGTGAPAVDSPDEPGHPGGP
jgi:hypothetical protein